MFTMKIIDENEAIEKDHWSKVWPLAVMIPSSDAYKGIKNIMQE